MKQTTLAAKRQIALERIETLSSVIAEELGIDEYATLGRIPGNQPTDIQQLMRVENTAAFLEMVREAVAPEPEPAKEKTADKPTVKPTTTTKKGKG